LEGVRERYIWAGLLQRNFGRAYTRLQVYAHRCWGRPVKPGGATEGSDTGEDPGGGSKISLCLEKKIRQATTVVKKMSKELWSCGGEGD